MKSVSLLSLLTLILAMNCSQDVAGGASTSENGIVATVVMTPQNEPVSNAVVTLYHSGYDINSTLPLIESITDENGKALFSSIAEGTYSLIAEDSELLGIIYPVAVKESSFVEIIIDKSSNVIIDVADSISAVKFAGIPYVAEYDALQDRFIFNKLPAGTFPSLNFITDSEEIFSMEGFELSSGDSVLLEIIIENDSVKIQGALKTLFGTWGKEEPFTPFNTKAISIASAYSNTSFTGTTDGGLWYAQDDFYSEMPTTTSPWVNDTIEAISLAPFYDDSYKEMRLFQTSAGTIWYFEQGYYDLGTDVITEKFGKKSNAIFVDSVYNSWVAFDSEVYRYSYAQVAWSTVPNSAGVISITGSGDKTIFLGFSNGTIRAMTATDTANYTLIDSEGTQRVPTSMALSTNGELFVGCEIGVLKLVGSTFVEVHRFNVSTHSLTTGETGIIWGVFGESGLFSVQQDTISIIEKTGSTPFHFYDLCSFGDTLIKIAAGDSAIVTFSPE